jgi:hypothetical protein
VDAVARASAIGIGAGNPIYYDMEAYSRTASNSSSVLRFLAAWTSELHAQGYVSGAYGSGGSGIRDMAAAFGTGYTEPDDIWIGDWNSLETIDDPYVPAGDWTPHRRVHQYRGAHAERHGAVTLSIDGDYVDGATASASGVMNDRVLRPTLSVTSLADGTMRLHLSWPGVTGITRWRVLGGSSTSSLIPIGRSRRGGSRAAITSHSAYPYFEAQAIGPSGAVLASTPVAATPPHVAIYGRTIFIPGGGLGAVPVGCFTVSACELSTTILAGRTRLARTRPEQIPAGGAALVRFRLSALGRSALARAANRRLPVSVTVRDVSGRSATRRLIMIPVVLNGPGPARAVENSPTLRLLTLTDFVSSRGVGGILAGCFDTAPCRVTTAITSGRTRLARTGPEVLGVNEVGYLTFRLTPQALARLAHALGHQLRARVTLSDRGAVATATVALAAFR